MSARLTKGYITLDRSIFDHWISRNPARFLAWTQMLSDAAFTADQHKGLWGVVHLNRGELVGSEHYLAKQWGRKWSRSAVQRFLQRLEAMGAIVRRRMRAGQPTGQPTGQPLAHDVTIITICNYNSFQTASTKAKAAVGNPPGNPPGNQTSQAPDIPGLIPALNTEPSNQSKNREEAGWGVKRPSAATKPMPRDGMTKRTSNGEIRFVVYGTIEWHVYADDYAQKKGAVPLPSTYANGRGKWFRRHGETGRPAELWTAERMERAEKAAQMEGRAA